MESEKKLLKKSDKDFRKLAFNDLFYILVFAFTYISALAWNESFIIFFNKHPFFKQKGWYWLYPIVVTIIAFGVLFAISVTKNNLHIKM